MKAIIDNNILIAGVIKKNLKRHRDERGYFEELVRVTDEFFKEGFGQLSHSFMFTGVIKAWHIHKTQIDWWYCTKGDLKVALCDKRPDSKTFNIINEYQIGVHSENMIIKIPPGVAHGCKVISGAGELLYITSGIYNPDEEGRIPHNDPQIGYDWFKTPAIK